MTTTYDCPNCGANIRDGGLDERARCRFCGTQVAVTGRAISRRELEMERDQILAREHEKDAQVRQEKKRGIGDFLVPPIGCCGIYFGLFVVGSLLLGVLGLKGSEKHGTAVAVIAIGSALIGVVLIIWRRERRRMERVATLEREWATDRMLRERRLREIESELEAAGD